MEQTRSQFLGCVISKHFEHQSINDEFNYDKCGHLLKINIGINDGVLYFDNIKTHVENLRQIMKRYFKIEEEIMYHQMGMNKDGYGNLDGKEMCMANILASNGNPVFLSTVVQIEGENLGVVALFLPENLDLLTEKQKIKTITMLNYIKEVYNDLKQVGVDEPYITYMCNGNMDEQYKLKDTSLEELFHKGKMRK